MTQSHFSLTWQRYQSSMCSNFSSLQQNGEFVDMTLAADGHLVKVHQIILGIASPYIKELLQSAPCQHPVIFLNNISYATLCNLMQYVYTGEVAIVEEDLASFLEAAKALHIQGLEGMNLDVEPEVQHGFEIKPQIKSNVQTIQIQVLNEDNTTPRLEEINLPIAAKNIRVSGAVETTEHGTKRKLADRISQGEGDKCEDGDYLSDQDTSEVNETMDTTTESTTSVGKSADNFELTRLVEMSPNAYGNSKELQYTVSNRGSLQLILNRYIYNLFSKSNGGQVRRWRCVEYRDHKCPACTVTNGNVVIKRTNMHNHHYHDKRILAKIEKKAVYSAIRSVEGSKDT